MTQDSRMNSEFYWDSRFSEDWQDCEGPRQSRFFARLAVDNLPPWLMEQIRQQSLTLADWGCAQGDGTDIWASYLNSQQLVGVDFSGVAIEQATERYPAIRFVSENWLEEKSDDCDSYDVVFSSNTLEHFYNPYEVLKTLAARAKKAVILVLPYRELERIDEHFYSFLPGNVPIVLKNGFCLVWSRVIDCRDLPNTLWGGDQIFLVYAETSWVDSLQLVLHDCEIGQDDTTTEIASLKQSVVERDGQITSLKQSVVERDGQITSLRQKLITLSEWAQKIDNAPLKYGLKKYGRRVLRSIYRAFLLPSVLKHQLKGSVLRMVGLIGNNRPLPIPANKILLNVKTLHPAWKQLQNGGVVKRNDILVFSVIDWHFRIQRPQHLARGFAKSGKRIFFFSNHFVDSSEPGYQLECLDHAFEIYQVKLHVKGAPAIYFGEPTQPTCEQMKVGIARLLFDFAVVSMVNMIQHPYWYPVVKHLPNSIRVYDCMDHHEGFGGMPEQLVEIEKVMLRESELIVVTSTWLEDFARGYNQNVVIVRNAGEYPHFCSEPIDQYQDSHSRRIIGYFGAIAEWFDTELVRDVALAHPAALILLIGNDTVGAAKSLKSLTNVVFTGEVPYAKLPYYLYAFDVCLLPFKVIPLTLATNPVKVYEYLAAGKPVVCVDLPEISQFDGLVLRARNSSEFVQMVSTKLTMPESDESRRRRQLFASEQTWDHRIQTLGKALTALPMPKISVVVLTYNNVELTKACLDSIERYTNYPNLELILVDNASSDGSQVFLTELKKKNDKVKLVLNDKNLGFAAGNNLGLKASTGEYLVMLNNDTVVTPGWLTNLLRHLKSDSSIGMIGPVTNNIGNEAKINIAYSSPDQMLPFVAAYTLGHMGERITLRTAAFFCVMMTRKVFEEVGYLDEAFGRGFFEDDDYCRRVEQTGMRIVCAEDVFIHHHLSASFNKLKQQDRERIFEENKLIYEKKWGPWLPHNYRS